MNSDERLLNSLPKEMKELIASKLSWIAAKENAPADLSPNKRIFCNQCKHETNHISKYNSCEYHLVSSRNNPHVVFYTWGYQLWVCAGCESHTLERYDIAEHFDFYESDPDDIDEDVDEEIFANPDIINEYFPKRVKQDLIAKYYTQLPASLKDIYREVIMAFNNELPMLCAIGIRALIEGICFDQEITGRTLEKKIEGLASILPKNIVANLHNLRFMGNEAAHELSAPVQQELRLAIEICEDLLNYLYELDYKAGYLNKIRGQQKLSENDNDSDIKVWC